jgi:hypothetical protein
MTVCQYYYFVNKYLSTVNISYFMFSFISFISSCGCLAKVIKYFTFNIYC